MPTRQDLETMREVALAAYDMAMQRVEELPIALRKPYEADADKAMQVIERLNTLLED